MTRSRQSSKDLAAEVDEKLRQAESLGVPPEDISVRYLTRALDVVLDLDRSPVEEMAAWRPGRTRARAR